MSRYQNLPHGTGAIGCVNLRRIQIVGDGIRPCLLQPDTDSPIPHLVKASFLKGYVPQDLNKARLVFILNAGSENGHLPKSYRPIRLSSVLLKTLEKTLDNFIRGAYLGMSPPHKYQVAYQSKSTRTEIHELTRIIKRAIEGKQVTFVAFIDIPGFFDNMSYAAIERALENKRMSNLINNWIINKLISRLVTSELALASTLSAGGARGMPSSLVWDVFKMHCNMHFILVFRVTIFIV